MIYKNSERMRDFLGLLFYCSPSFLYFGRVFNKTISPLALVRYMIIANSYPTRAHGIIVKYSTRISERNLTIHPYIESVSVVKCE